MSVLSERHNCGHHKAGEEDGGTGRRVLKKDNWKAGFKYRWRKQQQKTEPIEDNWSVICVALRVTRHKSIMW